MKKFNEFRVASYALHDTIRGLYNSCSKNEYPYIIVTKEDSDLLVRYYMVYVEEGTPQEGVNKKD